MPIDNQAVFCYCGVMVMKTRALLEQEYQRRREMILFMRDVQHATFEQIGTTLAMTRARAFQIYKQAKGDGKGA